MFSFTLIILPCSYYLCVKIGAHTVTYYGVTKSYNLYNNSFFQHRKANFGIKYINNGLNKLNFTLNYIDFDVIYVTEGSNFGLRIGCFAQSYGLYSKVSGNQPDFPHEHFYSEFFHICPQAGLDPPFDQVQNFLNEKPVP